MDDQATRASLEQVEQVEQVERDERFHEAAALDEIELFSELLIAAGGRTSPLSRRELDTLLGIIA